VLKGSFSKYMEGEGMNLVTAVNPLLFTSASVPWTCPASQIASCIANGPTLSQLNLAAFNGFSGLNVKLDQNLKRPYSYEESIGIQQELPSNIILSVMGWHRAMFDNIGEENTAVTPSDYTPVTIANPIAGGPQLTVYNQLASTRGQVSNLITNSPRLNNDYRALDISFNRRMNQRWMLFGGITWSRDRGAWFGDVNSAGPAALTADLNNPNFGTNQIGYLQNDIPVIFKLGGTYDLPWGIVFSTNYQHLTGAPEYASYSVTSAILGQTLTQNSQTIYVEPSGFKRLSALNEWDVRFSKIIRLRERFQLEPELNIYNLTNASTVTAVNQSANSTLFLNPTAVLPPRVFELGLRIKF